MASKLQGLTNLAWSMAHLDFKHDILFDDIISLVVDSLEDANLRDITELLSALAILKHRASGRHMEALTQHMIVLLSDAGQSPLLLKRLLQAQTLAMICSVAATVLHSHWNRSHAEQRLVNDCCCSTACCCQTLLCSSLQVQTQPFLPGINTKCVCCHCLHIYAHLRIAAPELICNCSCGYG